MKAQQQVAAPALVRWEYDMVVELALYGPLTGGEIACSTWLRRFNWSPRVAGGKLARIAKRTGLVEKHANAWRLTEKGIAWLEVRA